MASKAKAKKRPTRATSNIFAMFEQGQIEEFKEAFNFIDHDRVGFVRNVPFLFSFRCD